jgi:uncharacterized membrane protein YccC
MRAPCWAVVPGGHAMSWKLLAIGLAAAVAAVAALAIWQLVDRIRLRRRFAGIVDVEREIAARRDAFDVERAGAQRAFAAESAARRRAVDAELAEHAAELRMVRTQAAHELAETVRAASEIYEHHAAVRAALTAELVELQAKLAAVEVELNAQPGQPELAGGGLPATAHRGPAGYLDTLAPM